MNAHVVNLLLSLMLTLGFVAEAKGQTTAPPAQTQQQAPAQPGAKSDSTAPSPPDVGQPRADRPSDAKPNATIDNRSDTRTDRGGARSRFLGVDPTLAMVLGAVLLVIIVIALVAMTKRSEDVPSRRSV